MPDDIRIWWPSKMEKISKCALAFALISCFLFVSSANTKTADGQTEVHKDGKNDTEVTKPLVSGDLEGNCTANGTNKCPSEGNVFQRIWENREMLMRTMYVLFAVTGIVVLYFVVRAFRWVVSFVHEIAYRHYCVLWNLVYFWYYLHMTSIPFFAVMIKGSATLFS